MNDTLTPLTNANDLQPYSKASYNDFFPQVLCLKDSRPLLEIYKVDPDDDQVRSNRLDPSSDLLHVWERRQNLHGRLFRAGIVPDSDSTLLRMNEGKRVQE